MADMHPDIGKLYRDIRNGTIGREEAVQEARRLRAAPGASLRLVRADPYLRGHLIAGEQVVIGVTHAALAVQEFLTANPAVQAAGIHNMQFLEPVRVPEGEAMQLRSQIDAGGRFTVTWRTADADPWKPAAGGVVEAALPLSGRMPVAALAADLPPVTAMDALYFANRFVTWGPVFKTVVSAAASDSQALLRLALPPVAAGGFDPASLTLDPRLLNGVLFGAFALLTQRGVDCALLPLSIIRLRANAAAAAGPFWINVRLVRLGGEMITVEADIADADGALVLDCEGFGFKRMRGEGAARAVPAPSSNQASRAVDGDPASVVRCYLAGKMEQVLGQCIDDGSRNLLDIGFDSAGLTDLARRIGQELAIELFPPVFFEYPTLDELVGHFLEDHRAAVLRHVSRSAVAAPVSAPPPPELAVTLPHQRSPANRVQAPIAIIGMDGRFARSPDVDAFWRNLVGATDLISDVPADRWSPAEWFDSNRGAENKTYCKSGSFLEDISAFDPLFFNVSPQQATWLDPQARHLMEVAYGAAEDAGYSRHLRGGRIGVYAGVCFQEYWDEIIRNRIKLTGHEHPSSYRSSIAAHVSYGLDLHGPSVPVDNACASSLTALHLACQALRLGECDMAFACGVNLLISPLQFVYFSRIQAMSPSGRCHTFDRRADGFIPGEGAVALLLKSLDQAERDGDIIHAVIRGSAINHTGRSPNPTAPRPELQTDVLRTAWQAAGVRPDELSYIECHGTGTQLGDPIEVNALKKAFGDTAGRTGFCALGSAKAHIGHLEGAAGLAGVVKVVQSMKHRTVPRMPGFQDLNPMIQLDGSPFRINPETETWPDADGPRIAGVSGFGMTGNGAHVVVQEYIAAALDDAGATGPQLIVLSARNEERLRAAATRLHDFLGREQPALRLADVAFTLQVGREAFEQRLGFIAADLPEVRANLAAFLSGARAGAAVRHNRVRRGETPAQTIAGGAADPEALRACLDAWLEGSVIDWAGLAGSQPGKPRRISLPGYAFAREQYWFPRERCKPATAALPVNLDGLVFEPVWQPASRAATLGRPTFRRVLLVAAASASHLAASLANRLPNHRLLQTEACASADSVNRALRDAGEFDAVFFLAGTGAAAMGAGTAEAAASHAENELPLLRLMQWFGVRLAPNERHDWFIVSQGCCLSPGDPGDATGAGVIGLAYALAQGDPRFAVRNIDLKFGNAAASDAVLTALLQEPADPRGDIVRIAPGGRFQRGFAPADLPDVMEPGFRQGGVYVIVGGAGTVGSVITRHLLETRHAEVVWIGRRPPSAVADQIGSFAACGGRLRYVQADATHPGQLRGVVDEIRRQSGAIHGAIFAAVVFTFTNSVRETSEAEFRDILEVKTAGSAAFYQAFADVPLDFLCFFSSSQAFAFSGAARLSAYAAGITFADSSANALSRTAPFPVGIINWGFWRAFTRGEHWRAYQQQNPEAARERNIGFLEDAEGIACLERFVAALRRRGSLQIACLRPSAAVRNLMQRVVPVAAATVPAASPVAPPAGPDNAGLRAFLAACLGEVLQLPPVRIEDDVPFADYGIDSITSAGLVARLNRAFDCPISATVLYDHPSLAALTAHLASVIPAVATSRLLAPAETAREYRPEPPTRRADAVAVIGMAVQVPGAATPEAFWRILETGQVVTGRLPPGRCTGADDAERHADVRVGILENRDVFDPLFFNISPREAEDMSPYQRLTLQEAWRCLEDAGLNPKALANSETGVFIGAEPPSFARKSLTGGSEALIAARISYFLNLKGPALVVNTGCSSSAVAIHLACESLRHGESNLALAGGVFADIGPDVLRLLSGIGMLSPIGVCRPFDARADGTVLSEGVAVVALKRLDDALRDGDPIHGVILRSASNQDGASNGITAPNGRSQEALLRKVYGGSGVDPASIAYVEAHGTGTNLGDPIEVNALSRVFGTIPGQAGFRALGSAKANIGHASAASGVIGLIKVLLSLRHETIPPLPGFANLNTKIDAAGFDVQAAARAWPRSAAGPRRAALNAFGHSGTNVHLVIEEAPVRPAALSDRAGPHLVPLSARTPALLRCQAQSLLDHLVATAHAEPDFAVIAWTLQSGRAAMDARVVFLVHDAPGLRDKLATFLTDGRGDGIWTGPDGQRDAVPPEAIEPLIRRQRWDQLAAHWAGGGTLDWSLFQPHPPRRISLPGSAFAELQFPPSSGAVVALPTETPAAAITEAPLWLPAWRAMPRLPAVAGLLPRPVLIVSTEAGDTLAAALEQREIALGSTVVRRGLADHGWEGPITAKPPGRLYVLAWQTELAGAPASAGPAIELAVLHLIKHIRSAAADAPIDLFVLTRQALPVGADDSPRPLHVAGAGAAGLAYALAQSDHRFRVRNIDLDLIDTSTPAAIMAEPPANRGDRIKLRHDQRFGLTFPRIVTPADPGADGLRTAGTYVIAGGSGTVGGVMTRFLCRDYRARVIWLGRSAPASDDVRRSLAAFADVPNPPIYIQADVTDAAALRDAIRGVRARGWTINGAIFSSLAFAFDDSIDRADDTTFRRIVDVKLAGGLNFYQAFAADDLDFLCYFSSSQAFSFSGATRFASYAAAMTAADSLAHRLRQHARFPIGILNWGFWKSSAENEQLGANIDFIEDAEGWNAFRSFTGLLRAGRIVQAACLRPSPLVLTLMPGAGDRVTLAANAVNSGPLPAVAGSSGVLGELLAARQPPELDDWMARLLLDRLQAIGLLPPGVWQTPADMPGAGKVLPKYTRWLTQALSVLARHGLVESRPDGFKTTHKRDPQIGTQWRGFRDRVRLDPAWQAQVDLLDACVESLQPVLQGEILATEILFPKGSVDKVEGVYSRNPIFDYLNGLVAGAVAGFLDRRVAAEPAARLRAIEIGAGTGGTTSLVLPRVGRRPELREYLFTDLSRAFLLGAEARFGRDYPCLQTRLWNIEREPAGQDIETGAYDVAIATNVLHATRDIRETLRNAKAALKAGGILLINEITENGVFGLLTFGLLDGWWLYDDDHLRIDGSPLLSPSTWRELLAEAGFRSVEFLAGDPEESGYHVMRAVSDGLILPAAPRFAETRSADALPAVHRDPVWQGAPDGTSAVRGTIIDALGSALKLPINEIDCSKPLSDYGVDSILGISFIDAVNLKLGLALNPAIVFEHRSVDRLAAHVASLLPQPASPPAVEIPPPAPVRARAPVQPVAGDTPIAIIGIAGQFPDAPDTDTFWRNLLAGDDAVRELPESYLAGRSREMRAFKWGGILEDRDCFDPLMFAITPREAESMSPHQRLVLQESWRALENAAIDPGSLDGTRTGVYIGAEPANYLHESFSGQSDALIAGRLAYLLNLRGPALVVNTGCSSGGVALHLACESLRSGETTLAVAGGVCANIDHPELLNLMEIGMFSPSGRCRSFSSDADGTVMSEAVAVVVLKRLDDALRDGDPIHATIIASGVNQDGASNGITAPNAEAQEQLIRETYARFHVDPADIDYVETHGTGTKLGDVVEANALARAFASCTAGPCACALGSAKSHIGHASAASGVVGLIKIVLSMRHAAIPGQLHFTALNPLIDHANSGFRVAATTEAWVRRDGRARTAALNCFGHSGSNVHLVVRDVVQSSAGVSGGPVLVPISARTEGQLREVAARLSRVLAAPGVPAAAPRDDVRSAVTRELAGILGVASRDIGIDERLEDVGVTPLHLAELALRLEQRLTLVMPVGDAEMWQSVATIAAALAPGNPAPVAAGETDLSAIAYTLQVGRKPMAERAIFQVSSIEDLREKLAAFSRGESAGAGVRSGRADAGGGLLTLFAEDDDLRETVQRLSRRGKLDKIAELWRHGCAVDWHALPGRTGTRKLHLPGYPFAKDRYRKPAARQLPRAVSLGSALLQENTSDLFQQRYTTRLTGAETFLADHLVAGQSILPAVASLEMARAAAAAAGGLPAAGLSLRNPCWPQSLAVDGEGATVHATVSMAGGAGAADLRLQVEIRTAAGALLFSAEASRAAGAPEPIDLALLRRQYPAPSIRADDLYRSIAASGVHLGPAHRAIEAIWTTGMPAVDGCLAALVLPAEAEAGGDAYGLHPSLMDAAFQTIIALQGPQPQPMLPFAADRIDIHALPAEKQADGRFLVWTRRGAKPGQFDLDMLSETGEVCVAIRGILMRSAPAAARSVGGLTSPLLLAPVWDVVRPAPQPLTGDAPLLVCATRDVAGIWLTRLSRAGHAVTSLAITATQTADDFSAALAGIDPPGRILWVAPQADGQGLIEEQERAVVPFFRFVKALLRQGMDARPIGWLVLTRGGVSLPGAVTVNPAHASLHGLIGSIAKEIPCWSFRVVDTDPGPAEDPSVEALLSLPGDPAGSPYAWRGGQWFRQTLVPIDPGAVPSMPAAYGRPDGVTVIIGGAGGIGTVWTEHLIRTANAKVVWLGRRPLTPEIQQQIDRLGRLGQEPEYFQADAADADALAGAVERIARRHGPICGLIHSAIVLSDQTVMKMTEAQLRQALRPKVDVAVRMAQAFAAEPLDYVLFFSSVQSFLKMPGQGNYAAGSCFIDAFAERVRQQFSCPVKVMNWGYWGDVGIVSSSDYQLRMAGAGMGSITPAEAVDAVDLLFKGGFHQIALMKPEQRLDMPEIATGRLLRSASGREPGASGALAVALPASGPEIDYIRAGGDFRMAEMEPLLRDILRAQLRDLGLLDGIPAEAGVSPAYLRQWLAHSLAFLGGTAVSAPGLDRAWRAWDEAKPAWLAHPGKRAQVVLVETTLRALPDVLSGRRSAPGVLFPGSSLALVERVYKDNPAARYFTLVLANAFGEVVARQGGRKLRILEIGAGTGGTSAELFRILAETGLAASVEAYLYTDVSNAFLVHAQENYAPEAPYLHTRRLDIDRPLHEQGVPEGVYDIVVAANSLHTTQDIRRAVRHAKSALTRGGVLLLNEISGVTLYAHLTFGLLEGWWLFKDTELRIPGCPGLSASAWQHVLATEGFGSVQFPARERHDLGLQIIIAESDGLILTETAVSPAVPRAVPAVSVARTVPASGEDLPRRLVLHLKALVAGVTRMPLAEIDANCPLEAYGIDSIVVIELAKELRKLLPDTSATLFFEHQTVQALADHLVRTRGAEIAARFAASVANVPRPEPAAAARPIRLTVPDAPAIAPAPDIRPAPAGRTRIAVIGMAGRYPCSPTLDDFWTNLSQGRDCITETPARRWAWQDYFDPAPGRPGAMSVNAGGYIDDIDCFDPLFFAISPAEAEAMNPQERLFLETAWACIEDAGHTPESLSPRRKVGVFVGVMNDTYHRGAKHWSVANRVSYHADFQGPSVAVDTACSSSLTALHLALESVANGSCECALAGGVNLITNPLHTIGLSAMRVLAADNRNKTFAADADGFVDSEGVGAVLLKPLDAAVADGDHIYGVILGSAINAGGKVNGYTVPNPNAQADVVAAALRQAGVDPASISYVEAHGTGTALGDPIEVAGLTAAFRRWTSDTGFCGIGSVKSNIGHGESAAGMAGLAKILLQMRHRKLVPSLHASPANAEIDFVGSPFRVQTELADWLSPLHPRRAGLSSFGAGGANAHVIIEEFIAPPTPRPAGEARPVVLPISAKTAEQLREAARNLAHWLAHTDQPPLADVAFTLQHGRVAFDHRLAVVADTAGAAATGLNAWLRGEAPDSSVFAGNARNAAARESLPPASGDDDPNSIARRWAMGLATDWIRATGPVGSRRRVSLPTYPFARERYWKPDLPYPAALTRAPERSGRCFSFTGAEPFLRDHRVDGQPVLPGVAYLELVRQSLTRITPDRCVAFHDVVWVSPFAPGAAPADLHVDFGPATGNRAGFSFTSQRDGKPVLHCKGHVEWLATALPVPSARSVAALAQACRTRHVTAEELQAVFRRMGVEYGPTHRALDSVDIGADSALARLTPPAGIAADRDTGALHPGLLDSAFQAGLCLIGAGLGDAGATEAPLPFGLRHLEIHQSCRNVTRAYLVRLNRDDGSRCELDLDLLAEDGTVCLRFLGLSSRVPARPATAVDEPPVRQMDELLANLVRASLPPAGDVLAFYRPWLQQTAIFLADVPPPGTAPPAAELWRQWHAHRDAWLADPAMRPRVALMEAVLPEMAGVLTGVRKATDVLFPNSSLHLVEPVYSANPTAEIFNRRLVAAVVAWIETRAAHARAGQGLALRILEVGAGTGGTTRHVLDALRPLQAHIAEYCSTDRSRVFLDRAEESFAAANPFLRCHLLDIEKSVEGQGLTPGAFDIVIAANVLHATRDMRRTMTQVRRAMRDGGLLVLSELSGNALYAHLSFGLLEGWWGYDDPELRIPGSPGLSPASWQGVLEQHGFVDIAFPAAEHHALGQQIVTASADHAVVAEIARQAEPQDEQETMRRFVRRTIRTLVSRSLKLDESRLENDQSFSDYGLDSILAVNLVNDIADAVNAPLTTTVLFDYNSVDLLTRHILATYPQALRDILPPAAPVAAPAPADAVLRALLQAIIEADPGPHETVLLLTGNPEIAVAADWMARERHIDLIVGAGSAEVMDRVQGLAGTRSLDFHGADFGGRLLASNGHRKVDHIICGLPGVSDDLAAVLSDSGQWLDLN